MMRITWAACLVVAMACLKGSAESGGDAAVRPAPSASAAASAADPPPPAPKTPKELLADHREEMAAAAKGGQYATVCKGIPWVNPTICNWVAAHADGQLVGRPDSQLYR